MTEISALTPSPPGLGASPTLQPQTTPPHPSAPAVPLKQPPMPKSSLYGDPAVMGPLRSPAGERETPAIPSHGRPALAEAEKLSSPSLNPSSNFNLCPNFDPGPDINPCSDFKPSPDPDLCLDFIPGPEPDPGFKPSPGMDPSLDLKPSCNLFSSPDFNPHPDFNPGLDPNPSPDFNTRCNVNTSPNPNSNQNFGTNPYLDSNLDPGPDPNVAPDVDEGPNLGPDRNPGPNHSPKSNPHPNPCHKPNPSPNLYPNVSVNPPLGPQHPASQIPQERPGPPIPVLQEPAPACPQPHPAPDTLSYLESASLMSGTLESLSGLGDDGSSLGSDSELNGAVLRRTDKYGFLGGSQYSESSEQETRVEVARQREMKWLEMFCNWDKWVSRRFQKVKLRCRKGIPSSLRSRAWQLLSNSAELLDSNPGKFEELEREQGDPKWLDIIEKDLHRQFPFHEMFAARGGHGQQDLFRILKAYTVYRPEEGYCQAQAPVAAVLLMHMPAEQAFWCLVQICEKYLPGYYSAGLEAIQLDGEIFFALLRRVCPMAYRHLKKFKIDPILYMTEWFMCIFSRSLPWACVLRVWDMFFCEGVKVVFRVGLVLLKMMLGSVEKLREVQGMYETMERLRNIPPESVREDVLITEVISLPVTEALVERESSIQVRKWRESRGELGHQPGRRLHGTRAIHELKRRSAAIRSGGSFSFLGGPAPPPGPLRASSSLLSLPGFRRPRAPIQAPVKKASFSGVSGLELRPGSSQPSACKPPSGLPTPRGPAQAPPSPQLVSAPGKGSAARGESTAKPPLPPHTLSPAPKITSEQITPTIPSPTANNTPLPPAAASTAASGGEEKAKKKRSKEDKKKEKEEEKQRARERKEKDRAEKDRQKKEKDKKKEKGGKRKEKGGGGAGGESEERSGATAPKDSA